MNQTNWNPQPLTSYAQAAGPLTGVQASANPAHLGESLGRLGTPTPDIAELLICDSQPVTARDANRAVPAVIVWGVSMTEAEALRFLQAGARGIVRKTARPEVLVACLEAVAQGRSWMEDSVFRNSPTPERYHRSELTPREQQVMELVEQGQKNRELARELGIRPGTVKIHLKHIFEKTGVRGRYGLALSGMREKGIQAADAHHEA